MIVALPFIGMLLRPDHDAATRSEQREPLHSWSGVAMCESTRRWHIATPPFYGGLQIALSTWRAFGGDRYAERPDLATRSQQIRVAERILASQGEMAWPVCHVYLRGAS